MTKEIIIAVILLLTPFCFSSNVCALNGNTFPNSAYSPNVEPVYGYKIIPAAGNTWGYDILKDNKIFIHQPNIPGMPGLQGFKTKNDALKVIKLVIGKIKKGEMPPTVSEKELKALEVQL